MPLHNPIISRVAPIKVGGSANAGAGFLASAFDHVHPLTETSGPTNLDLGGILDGQIIKRLECDDQKQFLWDGTAASVRGRPCVSMSLSS